jgi:hypothetical protein
VIDGDASVRRGDSGDFVAAAINAPLLAGDSVSVGPDGRAELQLDNGNFVRIAGDSEIRIGDLEPGRGQIQIAKGLITWHSLRDTNMQSEISTPAVAVHPQRLAEVRVEVGPDGTTKITVRHGDVEVASPRGTERVHEGSMMMVRGSADDPEYQIVNAPARDGWDGWNDERDAYLSRSQSDRYVNSDMTGTQDLDPYGRWGYDPNYGNVWTPNVAPGWAPYSNGQWVWEDYYGWTWVDYAPWGWAPFHYGSWYMRPGIGWTWFPGARYGRVWWRPAMVGFFGFGGAGIGAGFGFGNVGWVALAPFEVFHPWYGPGWFGGGARYGFAANVVHNANIGNFYRNSGVAGGARAVTAEDFQRGAFRNQIAVNRTQLQQASLVRGAVPMTPTANNLRFGERAASAATTAMPRGQIGNQRFFSRMTPAGGSFAARRTPFTQQQAAVRSGFAGAGAGGGFRGQTSPSAGNSGNSGWDRFGEPSRTANPAAAAPRSSGVGGGWDRFGTPQTQQRYVEPQQQRFEASPGRSATPYYGGSRPLQVAPPIVQSREAQSREAQSREAQSREAQSREAQSREAQSREAQSREAQSREVQSREAQPRAAAPSGGGYRGGAPAPAYHGGGSGGGGRTGGGGRGRR